MLGRRILGGFQPNRPLTFKIQHNPHLVSHRTYRFRYVYKIFTPDIPVPGDSEEYQSITPKIYNPILCDWRPVLGGRQSLPRGALLRIVSWNLNHRSHRRADRATAVMDHLQKLFGRYSPLFVVMLQEVHAESLAAIIAHPWIRRNFIISHDRALTEVFTIMLVSEQLQAENWVRVDLPETGGGLNSAIVVDIPLSSPEGDSEGPLDYLRLCTAQLDVYSGERVATGHEVTTRQLARISAWLKAPPGHRARIKAALVGVDMNESDTLHKVQEVDLLDIREETATPVPHVSTLQHEQKSLLSAILLTGRQLGINVPQDIVNDEAKRLDRFLYTGEMETEVLSETQDRSGNVGHLRLELRSRFALGQEGDEYVSDRFGISVGVMVGSADAYRFAVRHVLSWNKNKQERGSKTSENDDASKQDPEEAHEDILATWTPLSKKTSKEGGAFEKISKKSR